MRKRLGAVLLLASAAVAVGTGCSDDSRSLTAPTRAGETAPANSLLGGLLGTLSALLVSPIERTTPLAQDVSWSFTVGPAGALSSNSQVGLSIVVPPYALTSTRTITVTALAGTAVAYKFDPHGLTFNRNVALTQDLRGTTGAGLLSGLTNLLGGLLSTSSIQAAYFATDRPEYTREGLVKVSEILPALTSLLTQSVTFGIKHFSGYILASGRSEGGY